MKTQFTTMPSPLENESHCRCNNLHPQPDASLVPVRQPTRLARRWLTPVASKLRVDGGTEWLYLRENGLYTMTFDAQGVPLSPDAQLLCTMPYPAESAVTYGRRAAVYTTGGSYFVRFDSSESRWVAEGMLPAFPEPHFSVSDKASLSAPLGLSALDGDYSAGGELTESDGKKLGDALGRALQQIYSRSVAAGLYGQPMMLAYELRTSQGHVLHRSAPTMLALDGGCQGVGQYQFGLSGNGFSVVDGNAQLRLNFGRYNVDIPAPADDMPQLWLMNVAELRVLAMPQVLPFDIDAPVAGSVAKIDSQSARLHCYLPGVAAGMEPDRVRIGAIASAMVDRFFEQAEVIALVHEPFLGGARTVALPGPEERSLAKATVAQKALIKTPVAEASEQEMIAASMCPPNGVCPSVTMDASSLVVMADPTQVAFDGQSPDYFALQRGEGASRRYASVALDGPTGKGSVVSYTQSADSDVALDDLLTFSPLLTYPSPFARSMTLKVQSADGVAREAHFPLVPSADGRMAYWLSPTLAPHRLPEVDDPIVRPAPTFSPVKLHGTVLLSRPAPVAWPYLAVRCGDSPVAAVTRAASGSAAWDFGRRHFVVWGYDESYALSVNSSLSKVSVMPLLRRGVLRHDAVAQSAEAVYAALADGALVRLKGGRFEELWPGLDAVAVAHEPESCDLWVLTRSGRLLIRASDSCGGGWYTRTDIDVDRFRQWSAHLFAGRDGEMLDVSRCRSGGAADVAVDWRRRCPAPEAPGKPVVLSVPLYSPSVHASLCIAMDSGGEPQTWAGLRLDGAVRGPLKLKTLMPAATHVTVTFEGNVSPLSVF